MRASDLANATDSISITLRWIALVGLAASASPQGSTQPIVALVFLAIALVNLFLSFLTYGKGPTRRLQIIGLIGDLIAAPALFYLTGGLQGGLAWSGLLPVISAALFLPLKWGIATSVLTAAVQLGVALLSAPPLMVAVVATTLLPLYASLGIVLSVFSHRLKRQIQKKLKNGNGSGSHLTDAGRRQAIFALFSSLNASLNYQRVVDTALDSISAALTPMEDTNANHLVSAFLLFQKGEGKQQTEMAVASARRFTPADLRNTFPGAQGLLGKAVELGEPCLSTSIPSDPELTRLVAVRACQSAYCLPLRSGLDTYGVLLFAHPQVDFFNEERCEILDSVSNSVTVAIQNAQLYQDLEQEKERMMQIQEEARKKMARDLHDGPTQSVSAIAMRVNFARRLMERDQTAAAEELFKIEDLARRTTKEIRHMLFTLRPLVLESQGLVAALESMAEKMHETYSQNVIIQADPSIVNELEMPKQGVVFTIAEEAANNARKHAEAEHIWVRLKMVQRDVGLLEIEDDGVGFNLTQVDASYENRGSLGMVNMRERTELLNGLFQLQSAPGRGTRVRVWIPLSEEASDRIRRGS